MPRTSAMWEAAEASVRASAKHPFLLAMLDGTLAPQKFEYYICLLYTSPSPRDMRRSRMPSSA